MRRLYIAVNDVASRVISRAHVFRCEVFRFSIIGSFE